MKHHPRDLIARAKALMMCGVSAKATAAFAGAPYETVLSWKTGKRHHRTEPDFSIKDLVSVLIKMGHVPRETNVACGVDGRVASNFPSAATEAKPSDTPEPGSHT